MVKLVYCLVRRPGLTREAFQIYWRERHAPLVQEVAATLGIHRYVQSHTLENAANDAAFTVRGNIAGGYDGVAELSWDSMEAYAAASTTPEGRAAGARLLEDERAFIDLPRSRAFLVQEHAIIA